MTATVRVPLCVAALLFGTACDGQAELPVCARSGESVSIGGAGWSSSYEEWSAAEVTRVQRSEDRLEFGFTTESIDLAEPYFGVPARYVGGLAALSEGDEVEVRFSETLCDVCAEFEVREPGGLFIAGGFTGEGTAWLGGAINGPRTVGDERCVLGGAEASYGALDLRSGEAVGAGGLAQMEYRGRSVGVRVPAAFSEISRPEGTADVGERYVEAFVVAED